jgi:fusaric acid resistance family protein
VAGEGTRWRGLLRTRWAELRTAATGIDPGLVRLRLATGALLSIVLALALAVALQRVSGEQPTVVIMAAVLAMVSNIAVNETAVERVRVTTALLVLPATAAVALGTVLAPHRLLADAVFVAIMVGGVYIRRFGPRGFAIGMAAVMAYFFSQFLGAQVSALPWLVLTAAFGVGSAWLVRGFLFAEKPEQTLERLVRAFRARVHTLIFVVAELLDEEDEDTEDARRAVGRRRTRLNETALLIAEHLERRDEEGELEVYIIDAELAAERLADTARYLVVTSGRPPDALRCPLLAALRSLGAATATGTAPARVPALLEAAQRRVAPLVDRVEGLGDDGQRVAFAVARLADALAEGRKHHPTAPADEPSEPAPDATIATTATGTTATGTTATGDAGKDDTVTGGSATGDGAAEPEDVAVKPGHALTTRQAVQVGVATSLAIVGGELISPSRWYWAVIAAFVVFAGTSSRGDVLTRGRDRVIGTVGGVVAGMALAFVVDGAVVPTLVLLLVCLFLAIYTVRISPGLLAFWITALLALLYGLIGQFSVETLVLRIEETAIGAALGMLAGFLILPTGTREAFGTALDEVVDATYAVLDAAVERILGRPVAVAPVELARDLDAALGVLRQRAHPLDNPLPRRRGRSSYARAVRVFTAVDHYVRLLARISDVARAPDWAETLLPAVAQIRTNVDGLRALLMHVDGPEVISAERAVDQAEAHAAHHPEPELRRQLLVATRLLRRMDQAVYGFAVDLGAPQPEAAQA